MAHKPDAPLTPRQRQSQQLKRQKAARKKRKALLLKCMIAGGILLSAGLLGGGAWAWKSGAAARGAQAVADEAYGLTAHAGFSVQALYLEGRSRTSMQEIARALDIKKGDPILRINLDGVRQRLENIESIKRAAVERSLPDTLYVRIVERQPAALWQHEGKLIPVDDNGVLMTDLDSAPYHNLPVIAGDNAPAHVSELLAILASEPKLAHRFAAATRVGDRRWDILLNGPGGTIDIKLPEDNPSKAWKELADLEAKNKLLDRDVQVIDLRLEGRMFIKAAPEGLQQKNENAKET